MSAGKPVSLPATLPQAVREELRRALRRPYEIPGVVLSSGLLVTACWTLLPTGVVNWLFRFHGPVAFAMVMSLWIYSDVLTTNVLGDDPARSIAALDDPAALRRLWYARNIVLWLLATPLCAVTAIAVGVYSHELVAAALTVLWIATVPLGALGFASWVGVWFPFHVLPLRYRWARRRRWWRMLVRWMILRLIPISLVPLLAVVLTMPGLLLWGTATPGARGSRISDARFGSGLLLAAAVAVAAWPLGHWYGPRLASRRQRRLIAFLTDPDRG
ncbi:hypothetical protein [Planosporangium mesophilum]|uniref:Uncharacterized protein n=1 Tax=Planosporangium mesophilum TaxID=689768 RepID=A0A8J3T9V8_9ACTN|nr:hypothetical protein [Planosporangium mesophilum]NJC84139.1 hypothetical protein [Planosporangium mesophilum]GII22858.1 hypothetical protein Pme01_24550 [Planosporangium mesophilum]